MTKNIILLFIKKAYGIFKKSIAGVYLMSVHKTRDRQNPKGGGQR